MPKIIVLYILKQVTKTIFFTFLILFGILFFNESIQFLEKASRGDLYPSLLIPVLFYSLPATLEVSIPISVFLGILISIYNLNKTNELSFIYQLGMGQKNLTLVTLIPVIFCSFFVFFNSFYFVPQSNENLSFLSDSQSFSDKFKLMGEGKINAFPDLGGIIFAKEASDRGFKDVFANFNSENSDLILNSKEVLGSSQDEKLNKLTFESGNLVIPSLSGTIDLEFEELFFLFNKKQKLAEKNIEKMSLSLLIQEDKNEDFYTEFLKRLSLSLMLIISSLLAIPLSLRMAKKGRFTMILSGLVIFLTYYGLVQGQKVLVLESSFSSFQVFSVLHFIFVAIWLLLY
ncbi:LptF/LptG family permease, partial [SAR86 cluster bacterium]|nr:LptF/LptG family permease [SAR86 cluster bacterium]